MPLLDYLFGRHLATDEEGEQRVGVLAGIPMLGLDALGSAAYGPEAALTLLIPLGAAAHSPHRADQHADHHVCFWSSISRTGRRSRRIRTAAGRTQSPRRTWAPRPACLPRRRSCSTTCWWWPSAFRRASAPWSRRCRCFSPTCWRYAL